MTNRSGGRLGDSTRIFTNPILTAVLLTLLSSQLLLSSNAHAAGSISFVAAGPLADSNSPVTSVTVGLPAGVQQGDVLLAEIVIADGNGSNVPVPPAGWTTIRSDSIGGGNKITTRLYYKVAGAGEPGNYRWSIGAQWAAGIMGAWRGAALTPLDQASGATAAGASPVTDSAPSLIPANNDELQIYFYASQSGSGPAIGLPAAITGRLNTISSKEGFSLAFGDLAAPPGGTASPTYAATATIAGGAAVMTAQAVLLIAASQSGPTATPSATPAPTLSAVPTGTPTAGGSTSISFVGAGPLTDSSSPVAAVDIGLPTGVHPGDVLIAEIVIADGFGTVVPVVPTGWTTIRNDSIAGVNKITTWLYFKVAEVGEPPSYAWNIGGKWAAGAMGGWRGAQLFVPIDKNLGTAVSGASPLSVSAPALTPTYNNELQVYFYGSQGPTGPAIALSGAISQRMNVISSKEGFSLAFGDLAAPPAGNSSPTYPATATKPGSLPVLTAQAVLLAPVSQVIVTPTATPTPDVSVTATATPTRTTTRTATPIVTKTATATAATVTPTPTSSMVATRTPTATATPAVSSSITFVGVGPLTDASSPVTAVNVGLPSGVQPGDVMLAEIVLADGTGSNVPVPPAGWTGIRGDGINDGNKIRTWLYFKVAGAGEPSTFAWSIGSQWAAGVMGAWRGASLLPIDKASGGAMSGSSPLSLAAPSLSPGHDDELQVYFYAAQSASGPALTLSSAITQRLNTISSKEGFSLALADLAAPAAGTPSQTYTARATLPGGTAVMTAQAVLLVPVSVLPTSTPSMTPTAVSTVDVLTYHNDGARTGQNLNETILDSSNVNVSSFGKLLELTVDGKVDGQPLIKTQVHIPGNGIHNVLYVVTEHDSVYAFDADDGTTLWGPVSLLGVGEVPSDNRSCGQVVPEIGITATPVIDPSAGPNGTIYIVAMSKLGQSTYFHRIHALDLTTGTEEFGAPLLVTAHVPGSGAGSQGNVVPFDAQRYKERAGLALINGVVYTSWASHCDIMPYTGWLMSYGLDGQNHLVQKSVLNVVPNGFDGAMWGSGAAPAIDNLGNLYILDGNGTFDTTLTADGFPSLGDFGNAFLKLSTSGGLQVADYFATFDTVSQSARDSDFGSGGPLVLPDMIDAQGITRHLVVGAGKDSNIYLADRDNMGKFVPSTNNTNVYQELVGALPQGVWSMPAYSNNVLYYGSVNQQLKAFGFSQARLIAAPLSISSEHYNFPGTTPSISANGSSNIILWAIENAGGNGVLHAYDAANLAHELYNSSLSNGRDTFQDNKFVTPTIANGKVYVGTPNSVVVFGLLPP